MRLAGARSGTKRFSELLISLIIRHITRQEIGYPQSFRMTKSLFGFGLDPTDRPQMEKPPVSKLQTRIWFTSRYGPRSSVRSVKTYFNLLLQRTISVKCNQEYMTSKGKPMWTELSFTYPLLILICTRKDEVLTSSLSIRIILNSCFLCSIVNWNLTFAVAPTFATVPIPVYTATKSGTNISQTWRSPFKIGLTEVRSIRCRNRAQITVIMSEQKSYPIPYGSRVGAKSIRYSMNIRHLHISLNLSLNLKHLVTWMGNKQGTN